MIGVVDIGGTKIAAGVVVDEQLQGRREEATLPELGFSRAAERIVSMLRAAAGGSKLEGIAVASTGPIDRTSGVFGQVDTLPGWKGSRLAAVLRDAFGVSIVIENDADAAALGEATFGSGRGCRRFLYVTISTGIGGGIVLDGRIYRGANGVHPEIGHHMLEASGPACSCGGRGCWELLASGPAMAAQAREQGYDVCADEICLRADSESWARAIVEREVLYIGAGLANLNAMFAPEVIALGGGVMKSARLFLDRAREIVATACTLVPPPAIVLATLGADAGLLGAARAFIDGGNDG